VLDAVEQAFALPVVALKTSRSILNDYANMSSGTVMFVLDRLMRDASRGPRAVRCPLDQGWSRKQ
jgi:predicted naringenin-chalcone synthase